MICDNVKKLLDVLPERNPQGERVTLVAAVKTQTPESINEALKCGITDIGDNHVQEFKDKYAFIEGAPVRHFIGHLQTNKVKYLIGKVDLYHSLDRYALAEELSKRSISAGVLSRALIQINAGNEESKGGFSFEEAEEAYERIRAMGGIKIEGLMAMLPFTEDEELLRSLAAEMRALYDGFNSRGAGFKYLSMGMSGDWKLCIECGSNTVRIGTAIFGARNYN